MIATKQAGTQKINRALLEKAKRNNACKLKSFAYLQFKATSG